MGLLEVGRTLAADMLELRLFAQESRTMAVIPSTRWCHARIPAGSPSVAFRGIAGTAVNLAWICAIIGIILAVVFLLFGRRPPL